MDETQLKFNEIVLKALRTDDPEEQKHLLEEANEILMARRIILQLPAPARPKFFENDWFWRAIYLAIGIGLTLLGVQFKP